MLLFSSSVKQNRLFLTELSWHMYKMDSQGTMADGFFNSLYCKILFCILVKYKSLIRRALGGNDASYKSVSCLDKTSTPDRAFNRKKACWSSLHKTENIVPLQIKSATDYVCSSTMSSRSVSWSLLGPDDQWRSFHWGNEATASLDFFCRKKFNVINIIKVD
jgi:hypothetical protein